MHKLTATRHTTSGFSNVPALEDEVTIVGFVYGKHRDAGGYDHLGECTLAVYVMPDGRLDACPLSWFRIPEGRCALDARAEPGEPT